MSDQQLNIDVLDSLVEQGLARQVDSEVYDVHDLIREFLLRSLDEKLKIELHNKCSSWYQRSNDVSVFTIELIFHLVSSKNMVEAASIIVNKGRSLIAQGHLELLSLIDSLEQSELSVDVSTKINHYKGEILALLGRFEDAKAAFTMAQELASKGKDVNTQAELLSALADISLKQGNLDESLNMHLEALEIFVKLKDAIGAARSYNNMGYILRGKNDKSKALESYAEVEAILNENDDEELIASQLYWLDL